jgi:hypothetical protein
MKTRLNSTPKKKKKKKHTKARGHAKEEKKTS